MPLVLSSQVTGGGAGGGTVTKSDIVAAVIDELQNNNTGALTTLLKGLTPNVDVLNTVLTDLNDANGSLATKLFLKNTPINDSDVQTTFVDANGNTLNLTTALATLQAGIHSNSTDLVKLVREVDTSIFADEVTLYRDPDKQNVDRRLSTIDYVNSLANYITSINARSLPVFYYCGFDFDRPTTPLTTTPSVLSYTLNNVRDLLLQKELDPTETFDPTFHGMSTTVRSRIFFYGRRVSNFDLEVVYVPTATSGQYGVYLNYDSSKTLVTDITNYVGQSDPDRLGPPVVTDALKIYMLDVEFQAVENIVVDYATQTRSPKTIDMASATYARVNELEVKFKIKASNIHGPALNRFNYAEDIYTEKINMPTFWNTVKDTTTPNTGPLHVEINEGDYKTEWRGGTSNQPYGLVSVSWNRKPQNWVAPSGHDVE